MNDFPLTVPRNGSYHGETYLLMIGSLGEVRGDGMAHTPLGTASSDVAARIIIVGQR